MYGPVIAGGLVDGSISHHVGYGACCEMATCISVVDISGVIVTGNVMVGSVSMLGVYTVVAICVPAS